MATINIDYYKAFGLTKSPLFGAACIDQVSSYTRAFPFSLRRTSLIQYLSRGIQFSRASLNGALTQYKTKTLKH